jgi:Glyoxalase-like domain
MTAAIDHLVYSVPDLHAAIDEIAQLTGVRAEYGGRHPGLGTHNALLSLGRRTYLEIIAPDPSQRPAQPRPFGIDDRPACGLRGWAAAPDDLDTAVQASLASGFDYGTVVGGQRDTADGQRLTWRMTTSPADEQDGVVPFLIDWTDSPHPAQGAPSGVTLTEFRLATPDPERLATRLRVLGLDLAIDMADQPGLRAVLTTPRGETILRSP